MSAFLIVCAGCGAHCDRRGDDCRGRVLFQTDAPGHLCEAHEAAVAEEQLRDKKEATAK